MPGRIIRTNPRAVAVALVGTERVRVTFADGRVLEFPVAWSQRLVKATPEQRAHIVIVADGLGLYWPDVDEDIDVRALLTAETLFDWPMDINVKHEETATIE